MTADYTPCCYGCYDGRGWWIETDPSGDPIQVQCPCDGEATPDDPWDKQRCNDKISAYAAGTEWT